MTYDYIIIGAGSTGLTAASFAAQVGVNVLLVEANKIGGDCTWTGCVPSKALLYSASVVRDFHSGKNQGWFSGDFEINFPKIQQFIQSAIDEIASTETPEVLREEGIDVVLGKAQFISKNEIEANGDIYSGNKFLICTGAKPGLPPITGINNVPYYTYETIFDIKELPRHLMIIGEGPLGCELGQAFRAFGSKVSIVEATDRLLIKDDPDASYLLAQVFRKEKIDLLFNQEVKKISYTDQSDEIKIALQNSTLRGDALLLATGRNPNVDSLNLNGIGVNLNEQGGIAVNKNLVTSQGNIYAAGDCIGGLQFTHLGGYQGFIATRNALFPGSMNGIPDHIPWTTFTSPAVAHVGLHNLATYNKPEEVETCNWPLSKVDRAVTEGKTKGFIKIFHKKDGTILGVTIVAPHAGEMISEWIFAMNHGKKIGDISETIHVYPTYSMGAMRAATTIRMNQLLSGLSGKVLRGVTRFFR